MNNSNLRPVCPKCGAALVPADAARCRYCGASVSGVSVHAVPFADGNGNGVFSPQILEPPLPYGGDLFDPFSSEGDTGSSDPSSEPTSIPVLVSGQIGGRAEEPPAANSETSGGRKSVFGDETEPRDAANQIPTPVMHVQQPNSNPQQPNVNPQQPNVNPQQPMNAYPQNVQGVNRQNAGFVALVGSMRGKINPIRLALLIMGCVAALSGLELLIYRISLMIENPYDYYTLSFLSDPLCYMALSAALVIFTLEKSIDPQQKGEQPGVRMGMYIGGISIAGLAEIFVLMGLYSIVSSMIERLEFGVDDFLYFLSIPAHTLFEMIACAVVIICCTVKLLPILKSRRSRQSVNPNPVRYGVPVQPQYPQQPYPQQPYPQQPYPQQPYPQQPYPQQPYPQQVQPPKKVN